MTADLKIALGLRENGTVVYIGELDPAKSRGLDCRCTCSACGDRLIARLGDIRQHHFAHHNEQGCTGGDESALHRFAKEIFQSENQFKVPEVVAEWEPERIVIRPALYFSYVEALLEQHLGGVVPDISLKSDHGPAMLVEILVTHMVDSKKKARLKGLQLPCLEIDLSEIYDILSKGEFDRNEVRRLLIHDDSSRKKWLRFPDLSEQEEEIRERVRRLREVERIAREKEFAEQEGVRLRMEQDNLAAEARMNELRLRLNTVAQRKESELDKHPMWMRNADILQIRRDNIPYYLNVPIDNEHLFSCHRAVWQSSLFISWVFNEADLFRSRIISTNLAVKNLKDQHPELFDEENLWIYRDPSGDDSIADVIRQYFILLGKYGFVRARGYGANRDRIFERLRTRVVALPPRFNNPRYHPLEDGILDTATNEIIPSALPGE